MCRVHARTTGHQHRHRVGLALYNGVGGQRGAQVDPFHGRGVHIGADFIQHRVDGFHEIVVICGNLERRGNAFVVYQHRVSVRSSHIYAEQHMLSPDSLDSSKGQYVALAFIHVYAGSYRLPFCFNHSEERAGRKNMGALPPAPPEALPLDSARRQRPPGPAILPQFFPGQRTQGKIAGNSLRPMKRTR